jgi:uncharacterized protein YqgC (DUF456 family)
MGREIKLTVRKTSFLSRIIRKNLANGETGKNILKKILPSDVKPQIVRVIKDIGKLAPRKQADGVLSFLFDSVSKFVGFVASKAWKFLSFSATSIFSWVFNTIERLKSFNWNASDAELQKLIDGSKNSLAAVWGSFIGQGIGWLSGIALGYGVSLVVPVIGGAALARLIAAKTAEEAIDELLPSLYGAIGTTINVAISNLAISAYINFRSLLKKAPRGLLEAVYGKDGADFIQKIWGNEGGPNMSFNQIVEDAVESISDKTLKIFIENLLEEAWDSFIEAGFVVASELDNAYSQAKQASTRALGTERSVELTLNYQSSKVNHEKIKLQNLPQKQMIALVQGQLANYKIMQNRDVGMLMGLPLDEYARAKEQSLRIVIDMISKKEPPFYRDTENLVRATIAVPDVKRSMLDWEKIKRICGGENGYMWGRFKATAALDNGRKLYVYAASEKEAQKQIEQFLKLSSASMLTLNITEEKKVAARAKKPRLSKDPTRIYPAFFTVINRKEIIDPSKGRATAKKNYRDARIRIPLWTKTAPPNYKELIQDILTLGF